MNAADFGDQALESALYGEPWRATFEAPLDAVPPDDFVGRWRVPLRCAVEIARCGDFDRANAWLDRASIAAELSEACALLDVETVRARVTALSGKGREAIDLCEQIEELGSANSAYVRTQLAWARAIIHAQLAIDLPRASEAIKSLVKDGAVGVDAIQILLAWMAGDVETLRAIRRASSADAETERLSQLAELELGISSSDVLDQSAFWRRWAELANDALPALSKSLAAAPLERESVALTLAVAGQVDAAIDAVRAATLAAPNAWWAARSQRLGAQLCFSRGMNVEGIAFANSCAELAERHSFGALAFEAALGLCARSSAARSRALTITDWLDSAAADEATLRRSEALAAAALNRAFVLSPNSQTIARWMDLLDVRPFRISGFGGFVVSVGAKALEVDVWQRPQARTLFAYLALRSGQSVHAETICDAFWPGTDVKAARANLKTALARVRGALASVNPEDVRFEIDDDLVKLTLSGATWTDWSDVLAADTAAHRLGDDMREARMQIASTALGLARGEFLPEYRFDDWATTMRERLDQAVQNLRSTYGADLLAVGDFESGRMVGQAILDADAFDEAGVRLMVQALTAQGGLDEARRIVRAYERRLDEELGLDVSPALLQLCRGAGLL